MLFKKIPRQVFILGMVSFFTDFASEMLYPITPIFLTTALGASMATVGVIEGFAEITAGLLKGYFGSLSDKIHKRSIFIVLGYGLSSIAKPLPGLIPTISTVVASRISDRIGKGIRTAPRDALLAANADGNTGAIFGFHRSMDSLGAVVGPLAALGLLFFLPKEYTTIYLFALIPSVFAIGFTLIVKDVKVGRRNKTSYKYSQFWKNASSEYKLLLLLITLFSLVNSSDVFLILKSKDVAQSDVLAILGYVFYNLIYSVTSYPLGVFADRFSKRSVFIFGLVIFSLVYFGFAFNQNFYVVWLLFAFYGIYSAATDGVTKAWISDMIPDEFRGSAIGLLNSLTSFGIMIGSILAGILWDQFGAQVPFLISAAISLIIALILLFKKPASHKSKDFN